MRHEQINFNTAFKPSLIELGVLLLATGLLYTISLKNYLLFRIVVNQFNVIIAFMVFSAVSGMTSTSEATSAEVLANPLTYLIVIVTIISAILGS